MRTTWFLIVSLSIFVACSHSQSCPDQDASLVNWSNLFSEVNDVTITSSQKVRLNANTHLNTLTIEGTLVFDDTKNVNLTARWIKINPGGAMKIGSQSCPYTHKTYVTFTGAYSPSNEMGSDPQGGGLGTKGLAVTSGATLEVFGQIPTPTWTRLASTAAAGTTTLNLESAVSWVAGNRIFISSTDFSTAGSGAYPDQSEDNEIISVTNAGKTITLKNPLSYMHWADTAGYERAEVGLLTRNIVFQGDESSETGGFGGHLIFRNVTSVHVSGAEFYRMGQLGMLGRYPIHFHLLKDVTQSGFYASYNSIHRSYQRCVTIHDGMGISAVRNVAYNITGHCFFLEDGPERLNTFDGNLGVRLNPGSLIPSDADPSVFWISNPNNTVINNAACGGSFGYWYSLPLHPIGVAEADYQSDPWVWPRYTPLQRFDNNVAHSHSRSGLMVDEMEQSDGSTPEIAYTPRMGPFNFATPDPYNYPEVIVTFTNFIGYKNREHGVWTRGGPIAVKNVVLLDNTDAVLLVPGATVVESALIIGETDNIGTVFNYNGLASMGRSRPVYWTNAYPVTGWSTYDNNGPQFGRNITFKNFQTNSFRGSGAISSRPNGFFMLPAGDKLDNLKFENANEVHLETFPNAYSAAQPNDINNGFILTDLDGSITGDFGSWIMSDTPFTMNNQGSCVKKAAWNAWVCPKTLEGYTQINIGKGLDCQSSYNVATPYYPTNPSFYKASFHLLGNPSYPFLNVSGGPAGNFLYSANVVPYRGYTVRWGEATPPIMTVSLGYSCKREWVILAVPYPSGTTFSITTEVAVTPVTPVASLAALTSKYNYFYESTSQHLYLFLQQLDETHKEIWNFTYHTSINSYYQISATCPGGNCAVGTPSIGNNPSPPLPPAPIINMVKFQATMGGCFLTPGVDSAYKGTAYGGYDPVTKYFTYNIYHTLGSNSTRVYIGAGDRNTAGSEWYHLVGSKSPIRGSLIMPLQRLNDLWAGKLFVTIESADRPGGEMRGYFGCVSAQCFLTLPVTDPVSFCPPPSPSMVVYADTAVAGGWSNWSWGNCTIVDQNFADKACGTSSLRVYFPGNGVTGGFQLGYDFGTTVDTNTYKYLSFLMKVNQKLTEDFDLYISCSTTYGNYLPPYKIQQSDFSSFALDNGGWTQVLIPLTTLGFGPGVQPLSVVGLYTLTWVAKPVNLLLDEIRFLPQYTPTTKNAVTGSAVAFNQNEICVGAVIGTATSPSTTPSVTPSRTASPIPSQSPSITPSKSFIPSVTPTVTPSKSPSMTPSASAIPSVTPTVSPSMSPSVTPSTSTIPSLTPTSSPSPSRTPSPSTIPSQSPTTSPSSSASTAPASSTPTSSTVTPSTTPSRTPSPSSASSPNPTSSVTPSRTPSPSSAVSQSASSSLVPSASRTPSTSSVASASTTPSHSPSQSLSASSSSTPSTSRTPSPSTSVASSSAPSQSTSPSPSPSRTPSPSSSPIPCPLPNNINCGSFCASSVAECTASQINCPPDFPFLCYNGECMKSPNDCLQGVSCEGFLCWDGSCVASLQSCPPVSACPMGTYRCSDQCQDLPCTQEPAACDNSLCEDGTCPASEGACPDYDGCPINTVMCVDGSCVTNTTQCMCSETEFLCFDSTCSTNCTAAPSTIKPYSYSVYIPSGETTTIDLVSTDSNTMGEIEMEPSAGATVEVTSVADSVIANIIGDNTLYTPLISLHVEGISSENFENPVKICLSYTFPNEKQTDIPPNTCLAFINNQNKFECVSDIHIEGTFLCGSTTHFSEFGAGNFKTKENSSSDSGSPPVWIWITIAFGGFAVLLILVAAVLVVVNRKKNSGGTDMFQSVGSVAKNPFYLEK